MTNLGRRFVREEEGQDIIDYAFLAAFISVVAYALIVIIGQDAIVQNHRPYRHASNDIGCGSRRFSV